MPVDHRGFRCPVDHKRRRRVSGLSLPHLSPFELSMLLNLPVMIVRVIRETMKMNASATLLKPLPSSESMDSSEIIEGLIFGFNKPPVEFGDALPTEFES